ncbi:MAG: hypothetical protein AMXMBFR33_53360 [Candidatus Xenobia bacterium]
MIAERFILESCLKEAAGVATWLGVDRTDRRQVVVKLAPERPGLWLRIGHEAEVLGRLEAIGIPRLRACGRSDHGMFVATDYVPGSTLREWLDSGGVLEWREALRLMQGLLETLGCAHRLGILHRDVKPENLVLADDRLVVIDWGLSRSEQLHGTLRDVPAGSLRYMAPELAGLFACDVGPAADLYSAGAVLFELLVGHPPYPGATVGEVLRGQLSAPVPSVLKLRPDLPMALDELLGQLLAKDPAERHADADETVAHVCALREGRSAPPRRTSQPPTRLPLVGRQPELTLLQVELARIASGGSGMVLLKAPSGGGKSRLLEAFSAQAAGMGARVWTGQGLRQCGTLPYQLLAGVFYDLVQLGEPDLWGRIARTLGPLAEAACAIVPGLASCLGLEAAEPDSVPKSVASNRAMLALSALLEALGEPGHPAVLLLDDVQWADPVSLRFLSVLHRAGVPAYVMVVLAARTEELPDPLPSVSLVNLEPLDTAVVSAAAEQALGPLPSQATEWICTQSQGNPLLITECIRGWAAHGAPALTERAVNLMARRLERLPDEDLQVLKVAAVLGRSFDSTALPGMLERPLAAVLDSLERARKDGIIWRERIGLQFRFAHDRLREAFVDMLSGDQRQQLHRMAAGAGGDSFALAYHYHAAGFLHEAAGHARVAADEARQRLDFATAELHFRIVLEADPSDLDAWISLGEMLRCLGRYREALTAYEEAIRGELPSLIAARVEFAMGEVYFQLGDLDRSTKSHARCLQRLGYRRPSWWEVLVGSRPLDTDPGLTLRCLEALIMNLWHDRRFPAAMVTMVEALQRTSYGGLGGADALFTATLAAAFASQSATRGLAVTLGRRAIAHLDGQSPDWVTGRTLARAHLACLDDLPARRVIAVYDAAAERLLSAGDLWEYAMATYVGGLVRYAQGEFDLLEAQGRFLFTRSAGLEDPRARAIGLCLWARGTGGQVPLKVVETALEGAGDLDAITRTQLTLGAVVVLLRTGQFERAASFCSEDRVVPFGLESALRASWQATAWRLAGQDLPVPQDWRRRSLLRKATRAARTAVTLARRHFPLALPHALREAGLLAAFAGRSHLAHKHLTESLRRAEVLEHHYEAAWTRLEWARLRLGEGEVAARRDLDRALSDLRRMGAHWHLEDSPPEPAPLSPVHGFTQLVQWGRRLVACLSESDVHTFLLEAARALLPAETCRLADQDERTRGGAVVLDSSGVRSVLCAPILVLGRPAGCLLAFHRAVGATFGPNDPAIAEYLVRLAGTALENARRLKEREATQAALEDSERRLRAVFELSGAGLARLSASGSVLESNSTLDRMVGRQCKGMEWAHLVQPEEGGPDFVLRHASGSAQRVQVTCSDEMEPIVTVTDLTHRWQNLLAALQSDEAELCQSRVRQLILAPLEQLRAKLPPEEASSSLLAEILAEIEQLAGGLRGMKDRPLSIVALVSNFEKTMDIELEYAIEEPVGSGLCFRFAYRLIQEALNNVARHSRACKVAVSLKASSGWLEGSVEDNGKGFESFTTASSGRLHYGLEGMRFRAELLGGLLQVNSAPGQGTVVRFRLPVTEGIDLCDRTDRVASTPGSSSREARPDTLGPVGD